MVDDKYINKQLKDLYGEQDGNANFRLVFTRGQTEYRRGTFMDYNESGTYLRTITEFRLVPRYSYLPNDFWVIERLYPVPSTLDHIYPGKKWTYEPIFFYSKPDASRLPVTKDSVHAAIHISLFAERKKRDIAAEELAEYEKQVDIMYQFLSDECPPMATQLRFGEAIVHPGLNNGSDNRIVSTEGNSGIQAGNDNVVHSDSPGTQG